MPLSVVSTGLRAPLWRGLRALLRLVAGLLFAAWSLLLLAWLTLHWGILPHIDEWRPRVEALASRSLGVPVRIGHIEVRSGSWVPAAELRDVVLLDAQNREALRLPRVAAALSVPALLALELRFEQLLIEDARLDVRRDSAGRLHVAGLDLQAADGGAEVTDWIFEQHEFVIRGGSLRWIDEQRNAPPLVLEQVQLVLRNGLRRHDLRLDATPPAGWGERFTLQGLFRQPLWTRAGDFSRWSGTLHASLPLADVSALRRHVTLPFGLDQGAGALRAWVELNDGRALAATADVALRDVTLRLGRELQPLDIAELRGRLVAERRGNELHLAARNFSFATGTGLRWPEGQLALTLQQRDPGPGAALDATPVTGGEFSADQLELALLAGIAERTPLGAGLRRLLGELAPEGRVNGLALRWDGPLDAPRQYQARATMKGVSIASAPSPEPGGVGRPGWRNADIEVNASETGGQARLALPGGALDFPGVFEQPLVPLARFDAQLQWRITPAPKGDGPPQIELKVKEARFENDDVHGELNATWHTGAAAGFGKGARLPGVLDLGGKLTRGRAVAVARFLPLGLPQAARDYVHRAVRGGEVGATSFKVRGDLSEFPFYKARDGEFRIAGEVKGVELAYVPDGPASGSDAASTSPWPAFTQLEGQLVFERTSMTIRDARARLWGLELREVNGGIPDLVDNPRLEIEGQARGPLSDLLRYVNTTPVGEWTQRQLAGASASGAAELKLALKLPIKQAGQASARGSVQLAGNDLRVRPDLPPLLATRGRLDFTQKGFSVSGATTRVFGGEAGLDGGSQPDGSLRFNLQGQASADGLRRAGELPALAALARVSALLQGSAPYRLQFGVVKGWPEFTLSSPLTGMAIDLPAPLGKPAGTALPLKVQSTLVAESLAGGPVRDQLRVELGPQAQALFQRDLSQDPPQVQRAALALQAPLPAPVPGGQADLQFDSLDVDAWQAALRRLQGPASAAAMAPGDAAYLPAALKVRAQTLLAGSRRVTGLNLSLNRTRIDGDEAWRATVEADQLAGLVEYREPRSAGGAGRVYARLARLSLPPTEAENIEALLDTASPSVPALDIVVDDFELRGKKLGRLEVEALNRGIATGDAPREWRLNKLALRTPEAQLTGSGQWVALPGAPRRRMVLDYRLELADSGALLERLGFGRVMRGGKGHLAGRLQWSGSPLALDLPTLEGQTTVSLEAGQILQAGPGAARLLGVLSLQSLPRRLLLDFRDVFQEGFVFDNVGGEVAIQRGVASTRGLRLRGLQATVLMEGQADLGRETQDLRVFVVPEINAGAASLAYAAINPAIGLTTFVAQWLLRRPLMAANTREFHVTGAWDEPKVERVERKPGAETPSTDLPEGPAAAASAPVKTP